MVDFPAYSDDELTQLARDYLSFEAGLVGVDLDVGVGSDADMTARLLAALLSMSTKQAQAVMTAASPVKALGAFLRQHATDYGIGPTLDRVGVDALKASGYAIVVCTAGSTAVPSGLTLRAPDGQTYVTTDSATAPASATGTVLIGWRYGSSRRRFVIGTGDGTLTTTFTPQVGDVLTAVAGTNELCAVSESVGSGTGSQSERFELYNDLDELPVRFTRALAVLVPIEAVTAGRAGNRDAKAALTVVSPPGGVSTSAFVVYCDRGRDAMTVPEMRTALRDLFATRQTQGKASDLRDLALATPRADIDDCIVMPGFFGVGTNYLRPMARFGRAISATRSTVVEQYVGGLGPRGIKVRAGGVIEIAANSTSINVDCAVGYGPDFKITQNAGYHLAVVKDVTAMETTNVLITGVTDTSTLPRVGDRIIVTLNITPTTVIAQKRAFAVQARVLGSLFVSSGNYIVNVDAPICFYNYAAVVTAGGPLGQQLIDAIVESHDTRLPSVPTATPFATFPDLEASTNQGALMAALSRVPGVVDVQVSADEAYTMTGSEVWALGPMILRMHAG